MIKSSLLLALLLVSCTHRPPAQKTQPQVTPQKACSKYVRKDWPHWSDRDKNCLNTRHETLKMRSTVPVTMNKKGCLVVAGRWDDYYFPEVHTLSKKVDIDHLIPLKYAHEHGAANWSKSQKETFANDPENLVITNLKYNRKKGAKGIDQWLPVHHAYACKYIRDWTRIKSKYRLPITESDKETIQLAKCKP